VPCVLLRVFLGELCLARSLPPRYLHPFPTRRSSDLAAMLLAPMRPWKRFVRAWSRACDTGAALMSWADEAGSMRLDRRGWADERSEEHTSELQSRFDLVCRLLLEKKQHPLSVYA